MGKFRPADLKTQKFGVVLLKLNGIKTSEIAKQLSRDPTWVRKWWKRYQNDESLEDKKRFERPPVLGMPLKKRIERLLLSKHSLRKIQAKLASKNINVSLGYLSKIAKQKKLRNVSRKVKPFLSDEQKANRIKFAKRYLKKRSKKDR